MKKIILRSLLGIFLFGLVFFLPNFSRAEGSSINKGLNYLAKNQNVDGGLHEKDQIDSAELQTAWSIIAFASSGIDPNTVLIGNKSLIDFELAKACGYTVPTDIERSILAFSSADVDFTMLNCDMKEKLLALVDPATGKIGDGLISTVFGVFALKSQNLEIPTVTYDYLIALQQPNGGWDSGWGTESNITSQTLQALSLISHDLDIDPINKAKEYLKSLQTRDGGMKYSGDPWITGADSFSDTYTLQAIYSLGESPQDNFWMNGENSILSHLLKFQKNDGSFHFSSDSWGDSTPVWTTAVVLPSLNKMSYPVHSEQQRPFKVVPELPAASVTPAQTPEGDISTPISNTTANSQIPTDNSDQSLIQQEKEERKVTFVNQVPSPTAQEINENDVVSRSVVPEVLGDSARKNNDSSVYIYVIFGLIAGLTMIIILKKSRILSIALIITFLLFGKVHAENEKTGLIIRHSSGEQKSYCLQSSTFPVSSEDLFKRGMIEFSFDRGFLVSLDGEKALSAWEEGSDKKYWSHWIDQGNGLTYANFGAQSRLIKAGSVDAWQIGGSQKLLKNMDFNKICPEQKAETVRSSVVALSNPSNPEDSGGDSESSVALAKNVLQKTPTKENTAQATPSTLNNSPAEKSEISKKKVLTAQSEKKKPPKFLLFIAGFLLPIVVMLIAKLSMKNKIW